EVAAVVGDHRVEDGDDVRMPDLAGERSLVLELLAVDGAELGVAEHLGLDGLERDLAAGKGVIGEVYRTRRAFAELLLDLVLADLEAEVELEGRFVAHAVPAVVCLCRGLYLNFTERGLHERNQIADGRCPAFLPS